MNIIIFDNVSRHVELRTKHLHFDRARFGGFIWSGKSATTTRSVRVIGERKLKRRGNQMQRKAWAIYLKPEKKDEYKELHANAWPAILKQITACNIRNYSIFLRRGFPSRLIIERQRVPQYG